MPWVELPRFPHCATRSGATVQRRSSGTETRKGKALHPCGSYCLIQIVAQLLKVELAEIEVLPAKLERQINAGIPDISAASPGRQGTPPVWPVSRRRIGSPCGSGASASSPPPPPAQVSAKARPCRRPHIKPVADQRLHMVGVAVDDAGELARRSYRTSGSRIAEPLSNP